MVEQTRCSRDSPRLVDPTIMFRFTTRTLALKAAKTVLNQHYTCKEKVNSESDEHHHSLHVNPSLSSLDSHPETESSLPRTRLRHFLVLQKTWRQFRANQTELLPQIADEWWFSKRAWPSSPFLHRSMPMSAQEGIRSASTAGKHPCSTCLIPFSFDRL